MYQRGDHICIQRVFAVVPYSHHGIVSEVDEKGAILRVIHFTDQVSKRFAVIQETSFKEFYLETNATSVRIVQHGRAVVYHGLDVVARARTRIGERQYNLLSSICEHFATWCVTDKKD